MTDGVAYQAQLCFEGRGRQERTQETEILNGVNISALHPDRKLEPGNKWVELSGHLYPTDGAVICLPALCMFTLQGRVQQASADQRRGAEILACGRGSGRTSYGTHILTTSDETQISRGD